MVDLSCVIGVPDALRGSKVHAVIVLKKGVDKSEATLKSIKAFMIENVCAYAKPRDYDFVDNLPRTKLGKVAYKELEKQFETISDAVRSKIH